MKKNWKRVIVALYLSKLSRSVKVTKGTAVHNAISTSPFFPSGETTTILAALDTANTNLAAADAATESKSRQSYEAAYTAELQWDMAYRNAGYYVQTKADQAPDQAEEIITAGSFNFKKSSVKMKPPSPVLDFQARVTGTGNSIKTIIHSDNPRSTHFEIVMSTTPDNEDSWVSVADVTSRKFLVTGLVNGTRYHFKVRAINSIGRSIYSNVISQLAA